jgi:hypothetical protein
MVSMLSISLSSTLRVRCARHVSPHAIIVNTIADVRHLSRCPSGPQGRWRRAVRCGRPPMPVSTRSDSSMRWWMAGSYAVRRRPTHARRLTCLTAERPASGKPGVRVHARRLLRTPPVGVSGADQAQAEQRDCRRFRDGVGGDARLSVRGLRRRCANDDAGQHDCAKKHCSHDDSLMLRRGAVGVGSKNRSHRRRQPRWLVTSSPGVISVHLGQDASLLTAGRHRNSGIRHRAGSQPAFGQLVLR